MQKQFIDLLTEQDTCKPVSRRKNFEKLKLTPHLLNSNANHQLNQF